MQRSDLSGRKRQIHDVFWKLFLEGGNPGSGDVAAAIECTPSAASSVLRDLRCMNMIPRRPVGSHFRPPEWDEPRFHEKYPGAVEFVNEQAGKPLVEAFSDEQPEAAMEEEPPGVFPDKIKASDVGYPGQEEDDRDVIISDLRQEIDELKSMMEYSTHAQFEELTGGTMTFHTSDHHFHNAGHLLNCFDSITQKACEAIRRFKPRRFINSIGGDTVQGRGIFRNQHLDNVLNRREQQIGAAAWRMYEYDRALRDALPDGVEPEHIVVQGNHDYSDGDSTCFEFTYALRQLGMSAKFVGQRWVQNIADEGYHNVLINHGYGNAMYSPSPNKLIVETQKTIIEMTHRGYVGEKEIRRVWHGHCFDEETEILTPNGWRTYDKLGVGQQVLTYNIDGGFTEWNNIQQVHLNPDFKEMIHIKGGDHSRLDLMVSGDHGLLMGRGDDSKSLRWEKTTASEEFDRANALSDKTKSSVFLHAAPIKDDQRLSLSIAQIRCLAWIMTEGNIEANKNKEGKAGSIRIAQSDHPDGRLQTLCDDLTAAGIKYTMKKRYDAGKVEHGQYRNYDAYRINVLKPLSHWEWMQDYMTMEKEPLSDLRKMSQVQMESFLEVWTLADGHQATESRRQIACNSKDCIDLLQEMACKLGLRSTIREKNPDGVYYLTINNQNTVRVGKDYFEKTPYAGMAWCVTVPNGTLVVRRRGKTCITLNTHWRSGGTEHAPGVPFDVTGGMHRNDRANIGMNQRPQGWWMFVSPPGSSEILQPIPIVPKTSAIRADMDDPELEERNRMDAARCIMAWAEELREIGIVGDWREEYPDHEEKTNAEKS